MIAVTGTLLLAASLALHTQPGRLSLLDVPFISQSEALCGGAAAAMVLRYWGETGISAEDFAPLVNWKEGGIRTGDLARALVARGANVVAASGTPALAQRELADGRPVIALIQDRPGTFHYVVIVGWHERAVVLHDPARTPYVVMRPEEFEGRWKAGENWMAALSPTSKGPTATSQTERTLQTPTTDSHAGSCEGLVSEGVRLAQANDLAGAERVLAGAAYQCPGAAPLRELAGVRLLQRRWPEVQDLAGRAVALDASDRHAWELLAASRYIAGDTAGALDAWNRMGQPVVDLVSVSGLQRTTHRTVERVLDLDTGDVLTRGSFERAARQLDDLPAAMSTRLEYVPRPSGRAEVRAHVAEQPVALRGRLTWLFLGARAAASREVVVGVNSLAHGGERLEASWRFWPNRPRYAVSLSMPVASVGVLAIEGFSERQPFTSLEVPVAERTGARAEISRWATSSLRWALLGGVDRWTDHGSFAVIGASTRFERTQTFVAAGIDTWLGRRRFSLAHASAGWWSSETNRGTVVVARAGIHAASEEMPLDLWPAGDTGHARTTLLRAHPLLDEGRIDVSRIGRMLTHGSGEVRRWFAGPGVLAAGPAVFVDVGRTMKRVAGATLRDRTDVDVGGGIRVALPGRRGMFRADFAHGLADGRNAISIAWEPRLF